MKLHPIFREHVRGCLRRELAPQIGFVRALLRVASLPADEIDRHADEAAASCGHEPPAVCLEGDPGAVGAFDGHILKAIREWLQTPEGKAFLSLLVTVLASLLLFA